jgi:hypothetical protein
MEATRSAASWVTLVFMAAVTAVVMAMAFVAMGGGLANAPATFVYALTAAFGLEYLIAARTPG